MNTMRSFSRFVGIVVALAVSACAQHSVLPTSAHGQQSAQPSAVFTMRWPAPAPARTAHPDYVSPATQSISIQINNAQNLAAVVNNPGTGGTSKVAVDAPVGSDTFIIKAYDLTNAQGAVLSQAQVSQKIVAGKANTVSAVLQGVVASIELGLTNQSPVAGVAATSSVTVTAIDPDGSVIVGPGNYDRVIHLADSDAFATSLSSTLVTAPGSGPTLNYNGNSITSAVITASAAGVPSTNVTFSPTPHIYEFAVPTASSLLFDITAGPDGALWFVEFHGNKIGRITTTGSFSEFGIPTTASGATGIASGPDGALWFTEGNASKIGRITTGGSISEFGIPTSASGPTGIASGPDGALWFTEESTDKIGRITTGGTVSEFALPTASSGPFGIASGPDGALWFVEQNANQIGRITTSGSISELPVPTAGSALNYISSGPDGALWFTEASANQIGRITISGIFSEFALPSASSAPLGIAAGPAGALWFTENAGNKVGRIATGGTVNEYAVPTAGSGPWGVAAGPDGALWFTEQNANKIGRLAY